MRDRGAEVERGGVGVEDAPAEVVVGIRGAAGRRAHRLAHLQRRQRGHARQHQRRHAGGQRARERRARRGGVAGRRAGLGHVVARTQGAHVGLDPAVVGRTRRREGGQRAAAGDRAGRDHAVAIGGRHQVVPAGVALVAGRVADDDALAHGQIGGDGAGGRVAVQVGEREPVDVAQRTGHDVHAVGVQPLDARHPVVLLGGHFLRSVLGLAQYQRGAIGGPHVVARSVAGDRRHGLGAVVVLAGRIAGLVLDHAVVVHEVPAGQHRQRRQAFVRRAEARIEHADDDALAVEAGVVQGGHVDLHQVGQVAPVVDRPLRVERAVGGRRGSRRLRLGGSGGQAQRTADQRHLAHVRQGGDGFELVRGDVVAGGVQPP